jgi:transposase-like protein
MPWAETEPMKERMRFVADADRDLYSMTELCTRYGISRRTGYKWLDRYDVSGPTGLLEGSRAPHRCPHRMDAGPAAAIVAARRRQHPSWGPRKLLACWTSGAPMWHGRPPARRGICSGAAALVQPRRRRHHWQHPGRRVWSQRRPMICGRPTSKGSSGPATVSIVPGCTEPAVCSSAGLESLLPQAVIVRLHLTADSRV